MWKFGKQRIAALGQNRSFPTWSKTDLLLNSVVITHNNVVTSAKEVMFLPDFVCLSVCVQDNSKSYGRIFLKF